MNGAISIQLQVYYDLDLVLHDLIFALLSEIIFLVYIKSICDDDDNIQMGKNSIETYQYCYFIMIVVNTLVNKHDHHYNLANNGF